MGKTLYISDLDGTLLNRSAELSQFSVSGLNELISGGLNFSDATARTLETAGAILSGLKARLPIALLNGVMIYDLYRGSYRRVNTIAKDTVGLVIETLRSFGLKAFMYEFNNGRLMTYYEKIEKKPQQDFMEERVTRYKKPFCESRDLLLIPAENIIYFTLLDDRKLLLPARDAIAAMPSLNVTVNKDNYNPDVWFMEIFSAEASKGKAVEYLRNEYGYERVVCFGDNYNDLPMFAAGDVSVAPQNASEDVKSAADYICGTNYDDGVVKWIADDLKRQ